MRATIEISELRHALRTVKPAVGKTASLLALGGVLIEAHEEGLTFCATDLDMRIGTVRPANVTRTGQALPPFDRLSKLVAGISHDGAVTLELDDENHDELHVTAGRLTATLRCMPVTEHPQPRTFGDDVTEHKLDDDWQAIQRVLHARSLDMERPALIGVSLTGGLARCCDSYRLAQHPVSDDLDVYLPPSAVIAAAAECPDGPVVLRTDGKTFELEADGTVWQAAVSPHQFPETKALWPKTAPIGFTVHRETLLDGIKAVEASGDGWVRLTLADNELRLSARSDTSEAAIEVEATVDADIAVAFDPAYLRPLLDACEADEIELRGVDELKPWTLADGELEQLIMPTRVKS